MLSPMGVLYRHMGVRGRRKSLFRRQMMLGVLVCVWLILVVTRTLAASRREAAHTSGGPRLSGTAAAQIHALVWTQQRSGSTLTSRLLCAAPSSFCTMEPLRGREVQGSSLLSDIFKCHFSQRPLYFHDWMYGQQTNDLRVRDLCKKPFDGLCRTPDVLDAVCRGSSANIVKVATVELDVAEPLLQKSSLAARVVHLVRDPRAVLASRLLVEEGRFVMLLQGTFFTPAQKDPRAVCQRYRHDLHSTRRIVRRHPER